MLVPPDLPTFGPTQTPAEIVTATGEWLANHLGESARYVRTRREVVRRRGVRSVGLTLQTSSWSRAGTGTWIGPRVWAADDRVKVWKEARPQAVVFGRGAFVYTTLTINLGLRTSVELFGTLRVQQPSTTMSLADFLGEYERNLGPHLELFWGEPGPAIERLPDRWVLSVDHLFWWAASSGDSDAAHLLLRRYFSQRPESRQHFDSGRRMARAGEPAPVPVSNTMLALGYGAVMAGVVASDEII